MRYWQIISVMLKNKTWAELWTSVLQSETEDTPTAFLSFSSADRQSHPRASVRFSHRLASSSSSEQLHGCYKKTLIKRLAATSGYFFPGNAGSPSLTMRTASEIKTKTTRTRTRRLGGSSPAIKNILESTWRWETLKTSTSWMWSHAMPEMLIQYKLHLKRFDIQEDALTLWILFCSSSSIQRTGMSFSFRWLSTL